LTVRSAVELLRDFCTDADVLALVLANDGALVTFDLAIAATSTVGTERQARARSCALNDL
jgi:hypothetical protein